MYDLLVNNGRIVTPETVEEGNIGEMCIRDRSRSMWTGTAWVRSLTRISRKWISAISQQQKQPLKALNKLIIVVLFS